MAVTVDSISGFFSNIPFLHSSNCSNTSSGYSTTHLELYSDGASTLAPNVSSTWNDSVNASEHDNHSMHPYDASCHGTSSPDVNVMLSLEIYFFASLGFVVIGLVGNVLNMFVFTSKEMQTVSSNIYLLVLAISDSLYLVSVFLTKTLTMMRCWFFIGIEADIVNRSSVMCVLLQYLSDLFSDYSTCVILIFTIERGVAVFLPIRFKELCNVRRAKAACLIIFAIVAATIAPYHAIFIGLYHDYHFCAIKLEHEAAFSILYVIEMVVFRVVPVVLIAVLNAFIIARVAKLTRARMRRRETTGHLIDNIDQSKKKKRNKKEDRNLQLTIILILVSGTYIIAYIPILIHFVLAKCQLSKRIHVSEETLTIFGNYAKALYISGFAINFFLYTVSGRVFRDQMKKLLCPNCAGKRRLLTTTQATTAPPEASSAL